MSSGSFEAYGTSRGTSRPAIRLDKVPTYTFLAIFFGSFGVILTVSAIVVTYGHFTDQIEGDPLPPVAFLILWGLGLGLIIFAIWKASQAVRVFKRGKEIARTGMPATATITSYDRNKWVQVNDRHPKEIKATARDRYGRDYTFEHTFYRLPEPDLSPGDPVTVLVDPNDWNTYIFPDYSWFLRKQNKNAAYQPPLPAPSPAPGFDPRGYDAGRAPTPPGTPEPFGNPPASYNQPSDSERGGFNRRQKDRHRGPFYER